MRRLPITFGVALVAILACIPAQAACEGYAQALATMADADRALRARFDFNQIGTPAQKKLQDLAGIVDRANTARLKQWLARCGWPASDRHGEDAERHAWLLTQHADHDPAFQKRTLALIERTAAQRGEPLGRNFAYLSDRVAVAERRPQPFGTQLMAPVEQPCQFEFNPMDARDKVEERRAALGLPPLDIYKQIVLERSNCVPEVSASESDSPPDRH